MKKRIEIELYRYGQLVFGKVLHTDADLLDTGILIDNGDFTIKSSCCPELRSHTLFVWGNGLKDNNVPFSNIYSSEVEAIEAVENIQKLIAEFNKETVLTPIERVM